MQYVSAELPPWAVMWMNARIADTNGRPTTPAVTDTAPNVSHC